MLPAGTRAGATAPLYNASGSKNPSAGGEAPVAAGDVGAGRKSGQELVSGARRPGDTNRLFRSGAVTKAPGSGQSVSVEKSAALSPKMLVAICRVSDES